MKMRNREIVLIVAAVALAPLGIVALANYPVLTLCMAWMVGTVFYLHRWMAPRPVQYVTAPQAEMSRRTEDVLPAEVAPEKRNWFVKKWLWLWNSPNHASVMLGCVAVILFPVDDMFAIWFDDIAAVILFVKHARDIFLLKWGKTPEGMIASKAGEIIAPTRDRVGSQAALSPQRLPSRSPR